MSSRHKKQTGQALVLVTLALIAMAGIMGLAVDLGWMFFLKKEAQSAADAAALAAVEEAQQRMGGSFSGFTCPTTASATTPWCDKTGTLECSGGGGGVGTTSNLYNGCLYAARNGFSHSANTRQSVWVQAYDSTSAPPGLTYCTGAGTPAPCFASNSIAYWVSVSTVQTVPQLFSAVLGNTQGTISATGTAAVISVVVPSQFIALNVPGTAMQVGSGGSNKIDFGEDIVLQGSSTLLVPGPISLASTCTSSTQPGCSGVGTQTGGAQSQVCSGSGCPSVGNGGVMIPVAGTTAGANVNPTPTVGGGSFTDPFLGTDQPPLIPSSSSVGTCQVPGGIIAGGSGSTYVVLGPRQYYSVNARTGAPDGNPITLTGNIAFDPNSNNCAGTGAGGAATGTFSTFYFYGGLNVQGPTYFGPGEYAMVGQNAPGGNLLTFGASNVTGSGTGTAGVGSPATVPSGVTADTGAGTLFVLTNPSYSSGLGLSSALPTVPGLVGNLGTVSMQAGNTSSISLAGLDRGIASVPSNLGQYNGLLMWQDRADSSLEVDSKGNITYPTGCPGTSVTTCNPNAPTPTTLSAETMSFQAHPNMNLAGVLYQPPGASFQYTGNGGMTAALQIVTGGLVMTGGGSLSLTGVKNPAIKFIVALIH